MKKNIKSVSAALLSLCMLCGLLFSVTVLPTAATTGEETAVLPEAFEADFADLAAQVDPADFADGVYTSTATDQLVNQWVNTHFDIYATLQGGSVRERAYLGQNSQAMESDNLSWGGIHRWVIAQDGYLQHTVTGQGGEMLRKGEQMVLKTADGAQAQLENFEATVVFNTMANGCGAIALSFHEKTPGRVINNVTSSLATSNAVIIGNGAGGSGKTDTDGIMIRKNGCAHSKTNIVDTADGLVASERFATAFAKNTDYVLYVKVVAGTVTVKVTSADGATEFYNKTFENAVESYNGTISVGAANANRAFKSIVVRELDAEGNYVPFGTATTNVSTFTEKFNNLWEYKYNSETERYEYVGSRTDSADDNFYWNLTDTNVNAAAKEEVVNVLNLKFNEYLDAYGGYYTTNFQKRDSNVLQSENAGFWELLSNNCLQRVGTTKWMRNMRIISSMVPKSERTGEELKMTNFETSFEVYWDNVDSSHANDEFLNDYAPGSVVLGFRQQKPGAFTLDDNVLRQDTAFIVISQTGFTVMGGAECAGKHPGLFNEEADEYSFASYEHNAEYVPTTNASSTIKVRVVGDEVKLYIKSSYQVKEGDATVTKTFDLFNNFDGGADEDVVLNVGGYVEEGTVAFGIGEEKAGLRNIQLTRLDDDGNPINLDADPAAFEVDFSELAQITYADGTYDANGLYASQYDDDDINDWVNERFDILHTNQNSTPDKRFYLGQSSYAFVSNNSEYKDWGGSHNWLIDKDGYLQYNVDATGGQQLRKGEQLVLKTADGARATMENFEATVVFNTLGDAKGGVVVSFHEPTAGKVAEANGATAGTSAVIVGNAGGDDGVIVRQSGAAANYNGLSNTTAVRALQEYLGTNLSANTDYTLFVRVLNKQVTVRVTSADGVTVHYTGSATLTSSLNSTVSVGVINANRALKSIVVRELDADGNCVPFGTATQNGVTVDFNAGNLLNYNDGSFVQWDPFKSGVYKYVGSTVDGNDTTTVSTLSSNITDETKAELKYLLRSKFKEYQDAVGGYVETDFEKVESAGTAYGSGGRDNAGFWQVWSGRWLQRIPSKIQYKENMRIISSLVPLNEYTGEEIQASDFEATYTVRFENATDASAVFGFRQANPGKFTRGSYWLVQEQAFITVTPTGISFGAGPDQIPATQDTGDKKATSLYNSDAFYSFADGGYTSGDYPTFTITVKAEGDNAYLKIVDNSGTVVFNNFAGGANEAKTMDISGAPETGYIAYGIGEYQASIGAVKLTVLDAENEDGAGTVTVKDYTAKDNSQTIVVEAEEGFELKAGSLKAIDEDGNVYVPTRVGFRENATVTDRYEIPTDDPVVLVYEFVKPTLKAPNIGNIGNSFNENLSGLRFVSRFTRAGDTVVLDGKAYTLKDYGMLISSAPGIAANTDMTAEQALSLNEALTPAGQYVQKLSILNENKFYDVCDAHIDMAVTLINIDKVQGYDDPLAIDFYARPYAVVEVNGTDTVLYGEYFCSSYADVTPASAE